MKRFATVLFICALFAGNSVIAQEGLHLGVKTAPGVTFMFNKQDSDAGAELDYKPTFGMASGLQVNYHFSPTLGVGIDLLIAKQGQKYDHKFGPIETDSYHEVYYFKLPVLLHFNTDPSVTTVFYGTIGPSFNFRTKSQWDSPLTGEVQNTEEITKSTNISFVASFGAGINISDNFQLTTSLRFDASPFDAFEEIDGRDATRNVTGGLEIGFKYILDL